MKNRKRKITVVDVDEVINAPAKRTPENNEDDKIEVGCWPISTRVVLENIDDARFKALSEALK